MKRDAKTRRLRRYRSVILRRANEAIGLDRVIPFRVIRPEEPRRAQATPE